MSREATTKLPNTKISVSFGVRLLDARVPFQTAQSTRARLLSSREATNKLPNTKYQIVCARLLMPALPLRTARVKQSTRARLLSSREATTKLQTPK
jgi:hypothetical protein